MPGPAVVQPGSLGRACRYGAVRAMVAAVVAVGLAAGVLVLGVAPALAVPAHVLSSSFGSVGSGAGQVELEASSEVAVNDETHDIYVADTGNHRVDEFSSLGVFILAFGANVGGAGVNVCTTTCVKGTSTSTLGGFERPVFIAVDNSVGESHGDVYVGDEGNGSVSKFTATGEIVKDWGEGGQLGGFLGQNHESLAGVAVAPAGASSEGSVFVADTNERRYWFNQDGSPHESSCFTTNAIPPGIASDTNLDLYVFRVGTVQKFSAECKQLGQELGGDGRGVGLAVDTSDNDLYLTQKAESGEGGDVQAFASTCDSTCTPIEEFAFEPGELNAPQGLAVDPATHTVYVADSSTNEIDVYTLQEVPSPTVEIEAPSEASYTTVKVTGKVNPNGHLTSCRFEYALNASFAGAKSTPCASNPGNGSSSVAVEAQLTGLRGSAEYHVRLVAENRGIPGNTAPSSLQTLHTLTVAQPTITIEPPSAITSTGAHFAGQIKPNSPAGDPAAFDVKWEFQCSPVCPGLTGGTVAAGDTSQEVSEEATGLQPGQHYEVVLVGANANEVPVTDTEGPVSFTSPAVAPGVISSSVAAASGTEATLSSQIGPGGAPTTYRYEYISEARYMSSGETFQGAAKTPESGPVGEAGDNEDHEANATITGLSANTNYRFRIVAKNDITSASGEAELLFTHNPEGSSGCANEVLRIENDSQLLPDCRAYEQVSPADNAEAFVPFGQRSESEGLVKSQWPMQAAADGDQLAYVAEPPSRAGGCGEGTGNAGGGEGDEQLATRSASGWVACDIQPLASSATTSYEGFSAALEQGIVRTGAGEALQGGVAGACGLLYSRAGAGPFAALFTPQGSESCSEMTTFFAGGSSDFSQIAFESKQALAEGASASSGELGHENVYDSAAGTMRTVNVLPGASPSPASEASIGALSSEPDILTGPGGRLPAANTSDAVAANGSAIFWTNLATGTVYARINPAQQQSEVVGGKCSEATLACTLQVSAGPATYQTATPDGRFAYYTEAGKLLRYDTQSESREELAGTGAGVQGVIGVNETGQDGAYLYFVAEGKLAPGAEARKCEEAPEGALRSEGEEGKAPAGFGCNLYLLHDGTTSLVAVLLASDDEFEGNTFGTSQPKKGDWRPVLGYRSAQLSTNGQSLAFMSNRQLSGYQNINHDGECGGGEHPTHSCAEIYLFNAQNNKISCASCTPSGAPPVKAKDVLNQDGRATYLPGDFGSITHQRRLISANGSRVFFDSDQPLSPQDKNGVQDVYEWEQEGNGKEGRCAKGSASNGDGCVSLLSGGTSTSDSLLLDASESGADAFFVTRAGLVPGGGNGEKPNVFDARVDGGFKGAPGSIVQAPECKSAEECKEPAGESPVESFPASAAFSGAGNLTAPLEVLKPPVEKPAVRKLTRAQELAKALKMCKQDKAKAKRQQCEKQARKKYGPVKKHATKKAKQKGKH
jgi:DNA-binding beta-propeller fold protein YncE